MIREESHEMPEAESTTHVTTAGPWTVLVIGADLAHINETKIEAARTALSGAAEKAIAADPPNLLIDMTGCAFFGSSFIESLFQNWKKVDAAKGQFAVCGCNSDIREVFQVTRLDNVWTLYESREAAVEAASAGGDK